MKVHNKLPNLTKCALHGDTTSNYIQHYASSLVCNYVLQDKYFSSKYKRPQITITCSGKNNNTLKSKWQLLYQCT